MFLLGGNPVPGRLNPEEAVAPLFDSDMILPHDNRKGGLLLIQLKQLLIRASDLHLLASQHSVQIPAAMRAKGTYRLWAFNSRPTRCCQARWSL